LTLALGLLKGQKMDLVIEKATELGVQTIMPFVSTSTVATIPPERQTDRLARWQRIAQSAAKQSGSPLPHISPPCSFDQLLADIPPAANKLLFYEHEQALTLRTFASSHRALASLWIVIGPEGGFTAREVQQARSAGFTIASLGPSILRAETASIAAVSLCQYLWR
jgi:16S rRNA (uracil1498-N3)-methyltransferase